MDWKELARDVAPIVVRAVETVFAGKGASAETKKGFAIGLLHYLLPESPASAAPNPAAEALNLFGPIVDEAVAALNQATGKPAAPKEPAS